VKLRFRSNFAYVDGEIAAGPTIPLCRLRYGGSAAVWGFAIYRASHDDYEESFLPSGVFGGSPEEALDCACGLYLSDPRIWRLEFPGGATGVTDPLSGSPLGRQQAARPIAATNTERSRDFSPR